MFIKPAPGIRIRDPECRDFLPALGREVTDTIHWARRLADGDVLIATPPALDLEPKK